MLQNIERYARRFKAIAGANGWQGNRRKQIIRIIFQCPVEHWFQTIICHPEYETWAYD